MKRMHHSFFAMAHSFINNCYIIITTFLVSQDRYQVHFAM